MSHYYRNNIEVYIADDSTDEEITYAKYLSEISNAKSVSEYANKLYFGEIADEDVPNEIKVRVIASKNAMIEGNKEEPIIEEATLDEVDPETALNELLEVIGNEAE